MRDTIEIMALDANFNIVSYLAPSNIQWRRKWYESGSFSIQIPIGQYSPDIKYIYSKDRPEVGKVSQINYIQKDGSMQFALSGYFLERELHKRVCYKLGNSNITNAPNWVNQSGAAEDVAIAFFNAFKDVDYTYGGNAYSCELGIEAATSQGRGHQSEHEREGEKLDDKCYSILKPSKMSYRVGYDLVNNVKTFKPVIGIDRTEDGHEQGVNPVIFSTAYGNLENPNIVVSDSDYENGYIATSSYTENDVDYMVVQAKSEPGQEGEDISFIDVSASTNKSDYASTDDYIAAIHMQGHEELLEHRKTASFDFDAKEGSYEYLTDFDIGDICSLEVPEIQLSKDAVLIECTEVIKKGKWTLTLGFDTDD